VIEGYNPNPIDPVRRGEVTRRDACPLLEAEPQVPLVPYTSFALEIFLNRLDIGWRVDNRVLHCKKVFSSLNLAVKASLGLPSLLAFRRARRWLFPASPAFARRIRESPRKECASRCPSSPFLRSYFPFSSTRNDGSARTLQEKVQVHVGGK